MAQTVQECLIFEYKSIWYFNNSKPLWQWEDVHQQMYFHVLPPSSSTRLSLSLSLSGHFDFLGVRMIRWLQGKAVTLGPTQKSRTWWKGGRSLILRMHPPWLHPQIVESLVETITTLAKDITTLPKGQAFTDAISGFLLHFFYFQTWKVSAQDKNNVARTFLLLYFPHNSKMSFWRGSDYQVVVAVDACQSCFNPFERFLSLHLLVQFFSHSSHVWYVGTDVNAATLCFGSTCLSAGPW